MILISAYSDQKIYTLYPKGMKLRKRYEESLYSYVASDVQVTFFNAQDVYQDLLQGALIWIALTYKSGAQERCLFFGYLQPDSAEYDPEKDEYTVTALHCSKKIMDVAQAQHVVPVWLASQAKSLTAPYSFDAVSEVNAYHYMLPLSSEYPMMSVILHKSECENATEDGSPVCDEYLAYLRRGYTKRQHWIDLSKHYNLLWYVPDVVGQFVVAFRRRDQETIVHRGYDQYLTDYKESSEDAQYQSVIFPMVVKNTFTVQPANKQSTLYYNVYCRYDGSSVRLYTFHYYGFNAYQYATLPDWQLIDCTEYLEAGDRCLDLRVPSDVYQECFKRRILPFYKTVKQFDYKPYAQLSETPLQYAHRRYRRAVRPRRIIEVSYSEVILADPEDEIAINGQNATIKEIEYDLEQETTTITAEQYV